MSMKNTTAKPLGCRLTPQRLHSASKAILGSLEGGALSDPRTMLRYSTGKELPKKPFSLDLVLSTKEI